MVENIFKTSNFNMKVTAGEGVKSCGIHTSLWTWESHAFAFDVQLTHKTSRYVLFAMSLFAFVIIHQGHEWKEINLCLAAFIDPPLEN